MTVSIIVQLWLTERLTTYVPFLLLLYSIDPKAVILYYFFTLRILIHTEVKCHS